ncbi:MAG: magnesium transporter CorA family protein [Anaerolineae bacterium]|nr:magnesium transporter CorA family protein [Anaerolineae bacterium]
MITIYKSTDVGLSIIDELVPGCWIYVIDPTTDEIEYLTAQGLPQDFLTFPLDIDERPRIEREDDGTLLVLMRIPFFEGNKSDVPYSTIPLGVIQREEYFVTVCKRANPVLKDFISGKNKGLSTGKRNRFLLRILLQTASLYLNYLREINKMVDMIEDQLQKSMKNKEVLELLKYQKSLVYFTTALKGNELMLRRLQATPFFRQFPDDEDLLEDVITETQQAIEMTNISSNILAGMMDAFASIISNNLNVVMKFLASITIVLSLPTIITSFFGMNVSFPIGGAPWHYLLILAVCVVITMLVVFVFWKRDWF